MQSTENITLIHPSIFRAYDIRGIVNDTLTKETIYHIGRALGSLALHQGETDIAIGRDGRLSGLVFSKALSRGILAVGCNVIDLGIVPTPLLYYSTHILKTQSGVMLTGSHNPPEYNGLKMMIKGKTLAEENIQNLYQWILNNPVHKNKKTGEYHELEIIERYITHVAHDVLLARPLNIVIDCGNGVAGKVAPELFRRLGCKVHELFCDVDGHFPNHHPDPSQVENLEELIFTVQETEADIGLAFDGDGDRLGVVTNKGEIIWPDRQLMLMAKSVLADNPGASIIYDVKCTYHLDKVIRDAGGEPIMWKTGHSLIKSKLAETNAALAGEMSGHIFFKDRWYGFDDALYAGARLLQILASHHENCSTLFESIPNSINTPELKIFVSDNEKFSIMNQLMTHANFGEGNLITIDGLRVNFTDGWGLVRPSNTTPCLVLRFEAKTENALEKIKTIFRHNLLAVKPDIKLSF